MTPEAQRIAIAEACGWNREDSLFCRAQGWRGPQGQWYSPLPPDYINDLDAMHEAEKVILDNCGTWTRYVTELKFQSAKNGIPHFHLTAAQRAEAFLRTLNLWQK